MGLFCILLAGYFRVFIVTGFMTAKEQQGLHLEPLLRLDFHGDVAAQLEKQRHIQIVGTANTLSQVFAGLQLMKQLGKKKLLWVAASKNEVSDIEGCLRLYTKMSIRSFVPAEAMGQLQGSMIALLRWLVDDSSEGIAIVVPEMLVLRVPKVEQIAAECITLRKSTDISLYILFEKLISSGYTQSDDPFLQPGTYRNVGDTLSIFPINAEHPVRVTFLGDTIEDLVSYNQETKKLAGDMEELVLFPCSFKKQDGYLVQHVPDGTLVLTDEIDMKELILPNQSDGIELIEAELSALGARSLHIECTAFPESDDFVHLRYLSVLRYYTATDFLNDVKERYIAGWGTILYTKHQDEIETMCRESDIATVLDYDGFLQLVSQHKPAVLVVPAEARDALPHSFQNSEMKLCVITDREIYMGKKAKKQDSGNAMLSFVASLKMGDFVVHTDHGIGIFRGIVQKQIDSITREYLEIHYADNDRLFLPTDQADKITKYISNEDRPPKLTRLDSAEWTTVNTKVKKEAEKIAKELLELYAKRKMTSGFAYPPEKDMMKKFEETFSYSETPGQLKAIHDVLADMESEQAMDRLICGDVGFGKTEVAMRAAFKAFLGKKQVALISPITILADQHYKGFRKRMEQFGVRVELLSRFKSPKEQKEILLATAGEKYMCWWGPIGCCSRMWCLRILA